MTNRFDEEIIVLEKWSPNKPVSAIYWEAEKERYYVKRFLIENPDREENFIGDHQKSFLELVSTDYIPQVELVFNKLKGKDQSPNELINVEEFISIKGIRALGNQLTTEKVKQINLLDPIPFEPEEITTEEIEVNDEETLDSKEVNGENKLGIITQQKGKDESQTKLFEE